jgi:hypothetical protein
MKLGDLRRLAVRQNLSIRFAVPQGMECVIDERGVLRIPALKGVPGFSVEEELGKVSEFRLEPIVPAGGKAVARSVSAVELSGIIGAPAENTAAPQDAE